jgi:hypothetical protein
LTEFLDMFENNSSPGFQYSQFFFCSGKQSKMSLKLDVDGHRNQSLVPRYTSNPVEEAVE